MTKLHRSLGPMPFRVIAPAIVLFLLLLIGCGAAATATPGPTSAPQGTAAKPTPVATGPTATPVPTLPPARPVVNPGKLTIMVGDLSNERFDTPLIISQGVAASYTRTFHGFLISDNARKEAVPGIASQWDLSADGLTWTFNIRKGVKFHDGTEVTAEDVLWTLRHAVGPQAFEYVTGTLPTLSRAMDRIESSGPDKISLITRRPMTDIAIRLGEVGVSGIGITPKRAKLHDPEEEMAYDNNPMGAGPMKLVKRIQASEMRFERFDEFYYQPKNGFPEDKRVKFQSLDLFLAPEEATRVAAVRAGEADIAPASLPTRKQVEAGGGRLVFGPEGSYVWVVLAGCYKPQHPCHDKRVRQALDYAIDKELIRDRLYGGPEVFQVKGWSSITPSTVGYTPALDPRPFDPGKARQLLADAGYPGGKGFGKLILNTWASVSMPLQVEAAQLGAEFWRRELGIDVEVKVGDSTGVITRWKAGELNGQMIWRDNETRRDATASTISFYADPKFERHMHEDPEILRLVQETFQILDPDKQAEASKNLFLRLRDESYDLSVGYVNIPWAVGPRVLTWQPYPLAVYPSALHTITLK